MAVVVLYNPVSGAGRAEARAREVEAALRRHEISARAVPTRMEPPKSWLDPELQGAEAVIVCGGDGAVRLAAPAAARCDTPLYQLPAGTENLFAREFGMDGDPMSAVRAVQARRVQRIDLGEVNGHDFLLMVSVGFDAEVVHDLSTHRTGSITHLSYATPMLRQMLRFRPVRMDVYLDDELIIERGVGGIVIANCKHYGWRLNPAWRAEIADGWLDVVFLPVRSRLQLLARAVGYKLGRQRRDRKVMYRQAQRVRVVMDEPQRFQMDGDPPPAGGEPNSLHAPQLQVSIRPGALPVLLPAEVAHPEREVPGAATPERKGHPCDSRAASDPG